jgi:hypothetical protein
MPRYAEVCSSEETAAILDAYEESIDRGKQMFRRACRRSGIDPPDLDDFEWSAVMGMEEATALGNAERDLERATADGRISRAESLQVTAGVLDDPHPTLPGQTYRHLILTERLEDWLRRAAARSPALKRLREGIVKRLLHPVPLPTDMEERMTPVFWLLDCLEPGARLTAAGYLPTDMVREGWERFSWDLGWTNRPPRSESEAFELQELHDLVKRIGAARKRSGYLRLTALGRRMRGEPELAWRTTAAGLSRGEWPRAVAEVFTLLLLSGERHQHRLGAIATPILSEMGWRSGDEAPDEQAVLSTWWDTMRPLRVLGGATHEGDWTSREVRLTGFGEATLLEQIRAEATGPRSMA